MVKAISARVVGATLLASIASLAGCSLVFAQQSGQSGGMGFFPPCQVVSKTYTCSYLGEAQMIGAIMVAILAALFVGLAAWGRRYSARAAAVGSSGVGYSDTVA